VRDVTVVDAFDLKSIESTIKQSVANNEPSVIIVRGPCPLHTRAKSTPYKVDEDECIGCFDCLDVGCPAISILEDEAVIDSEACTGCGVCAQVCAQGAISESK
jgi:indolepyruvate ferredoxin oxidoreductase alpha subunit